MQKAATKPAPPSPDPQFVVLLASPRSGTHLLNGILATDPAFIETGETFRPRYFDPSSFWKFLHDHRSKVRVSPVTAEQRETQWRAYLTFLGRKFPNGLKILDFKYNHLRSADAERVWPEEAPTMLRLAMKDRMPIIHLKRRNHLEILCSQQLAVKTGEWVRPKAGQSSIKKSGAVIRIKIDSAKLLHTLDAMRSREKFVDAWIQDYGQRIDLIYEDLLLDGRFSSRATESIERLLNRKISMSPEPQTFKISPPLDELIENYDGVEKTLAGTPYAAFLPRKPRSEVKPNVGKTPAPPERTAWLSSKILSARPLMTFTCVSPGLQGLEELAKGAPEVFATPRALHLLHIFHNLETGGADALAGNFANVQKAFPGHTFLPLTATENETFLLAKHGVPSLLANGLIFIDETLWRPRPDDIPELPMFDAVYAARLDRPKRHELAAGIDRLLLIYGPTLSEPPENALERTRNILPKAFFANHRLAGGNSLPQTELCRLFGHSRVGLCLSAVEGCMRSSMEYLLSGLPVVSTPSIGGRERYYAGAYCRVAEPNADAVAAAVRDLAARNLDRQKIRSHVAQMIGFDRYNFLLNVNKIAKLHLGRDNLIPSMAPMVGAIGQFPSAAEVAARLRRGFATLTK